MMVFGVSPFTNWRPRNRGGAWEESSEGNHAPCPPVKRPCEGDRTWTSKKGPEDGGAVFRAQRAN